MTKKRGIRTDRGGGRRAEPEWRRLQLLEKQGKRRARDLRDRCHRLAVDLGCGISSFGTKILEDAELKVIRAAVIAAIGEESYWENVLAELRS